ncbi:hypothetical protein LTR06_008002 [Exophiala xenobiotica]|nr:hypothetical protein LTR06_008002 [Exophiala xenobiotica]
MAHGVPLPREVDTVIVGNGPSALILSYILHGNIPSYDESSPHPDHILHDKLHGRHENNNNNDLLDFHVDALTDHFAASRFSYSTQALPINVLLDTLVRPLGETDDAQKKTCLKWRKDPSRAIEHVIIGNTKSAGGQWVDNPVHASWDIGTLSYAGMLSLPGYSFDEHYKRRNGRSSPFYLRPSRREVADYLAAYPEQVGIAKYIHNGQHVTRVSRRNGGRGFYIGSHDILCKNLVLASGIFDTLIPPPAMLDPLLGLAPVTGVAPSPSPSPTSSSSAPDTILVVGSGFSAADVIISTPSNQKIIHVYKWAPTTSPSPLRACHQQAYPEYAGVYRRMKLAALSTPQSNSNYKRPRPRNLRSHSSGFDISRDWKATYEGLPNAEILDVKLTGYGLATVTFTSSKEGGGGGGGGNERSSFQRRVSSLAYVVGRRGSLDYLSTDLRAEFLPPRDGGSSSGSGTGTISGQTLREQANEDLEIAPHVFVIGSLTGDSLIRFAYGGCAYAAGKIMKRSRSRLDDAATKKGSATTTAPAPATATAPITSAGRTLSPGADNNVTIVNGVRSSSILNLNLNRSDGNASGHRSKTNTATSSPQIPAMNGLDGHEGGPMSLANGGGLPLDRRKD